MVMLIKKKCYLIVCVVIHWGRLANVVIEHKLKNFEGMLTRERTRHLVSTLCVCTRNDTYSIHECVHHISIL